MGDLSDLAKNFTLTFTYQSIVQADGNNFSPSGSNHIITHTITCKNGVLSIDKTVQRTAFKPASVSNNGTFYLSTHIESASITF